MENKKEKDIEEIVLADMENMSRLSITQIKGDGKLRYKIYIPTWLACKIIQFLAFYKKYILLKRSWKTQK